MRTRLRIPENREPIKLVVIDAPTAEYIVSNYLPSAKVVRDYIPEKLSVSEERKLKAIELYREGKTVIEVAGILGVGKSRAYEYLSEEIKNKKMQ